MAKTTKGDGWIASSVTSKTRLNIGGVQGNVKSSSSIVKKTTGLADTVATAVATVTVPNAQHIAFIDVEVLGILGAGGAVGVGETGKLAKYQIVATRTSGLACVITVSSAIGGVQSKVAGADNITSTVVTCSAVTGGNTATQTFTILVAITKAAGASDNHIALSRITIVNENATGVTVA